jgi:ribonuclease G
MKKKILINHTPWQTRIAITWDDLLQNTYFDSHTNNPLERSFFKGIVNKVLPGIQTAFVDIGQERAGFLHISEIDRDLAIRRLKKSGATDDEFEDIEDTSEKEKEQQSRHVDIRNILREREPVLVQVNKEPVGSKGAKLSTCFTLPGRFIVLMPNIPRIGISKKIEDFEERRRLRDLVKAHLPASMGAIIRTTCDKQDERHIVQDINYLVKTWDSIQKKFQEAPARALLYHDIDLCLQIVRDHLDSNVESIWCDDRSMYDVVYNFVKSCCPDDIHKIKLYQERTPIFETYRIEEQIRQALEKKVYLKSGGSIVIEATEAMTVVDVNTGRFLGSSNLEDTIFQANLEAAEEIVRQLRLRNIGGLIVIDFIDMSTQANQQKLYKMFEKMLRERDKFQSVVLKVSEFGLVQMTRKRSGKTLMHQIMTECKTCHGLGMVNSLKTEAYQILNKLEKMLAAQPRHPVAITLNAEILTYITTIEYQSILLLERQFHTKIMLIADEHYQINMSSIDIKS